MVQSMKAKRDIILDVVITVLSFCLEETFFRFMYPVETFFRFMYLYFLFLFFCVSFVIFYLSIYYFSYFTLEGTAIMDGNFMHAFPALFS